MGLDEHRNAVASSSAIRVAVVTASDTRTLETDHGGAMVQTLVAQAGFVVIERDVVADDPDRLRARMRKLIFAVDETPEDKTAAGTNRGKMATAAPGVGAARPDAIVVTGGTGIAPRDVTVDTIAPMFEKRLDGFGELFRMLSFAEIGAAALLSRACAGIVAGVVVFLIPGSPAAIRLALERLILPQLAHLIAELRQRPTEADAPIGEGHSHHHGTDHHH